LISCNWNSFDTIADEIQAEYGAILEGKKRLRAMAHGTKVAMIHEQELDESIGDTPDEIDIASPLSASSANPAYSSSVPTSSLNPASSPLPA
jgi:hypothetical protein